MVKLKPEVIETLTSAPYPVNLSHFFKPKQLNDAIEQLSSLIDKGTLQGIITRTHQYLPLVYLEQEVLQVFETNGRVDLLELLRHYHPINSHQFLQLVTSILEHSGFEIKWDLEHRKCYLPEGTINELQIALKRLKSSSRTIRWDHLIHNLKWPEDLIETALDVLASRGLFVGFLDGNVLYNLEGIRNELLQGKKQTISIFKYVLSRIHEDYRKIPTHWIQQLFQIEKDELEQVLKDSWPNSKFPPFFFTEDGKNLRNITIILQETLIVLFAYQSFPKNFLQMKLSLSPNQFDDLITLLKQIIPIININNEEITCPAPKDVITTGFNLFVNDLTVLPKRELLSILVPFIKVQGFLPTTGDENTVKGIKNFSIYCQICNDRYENPTVFHECMNCQRQTCHECYEKQPQRSCVYCDNIADFILDLPKYCHDCDIFYLTSTAFIEDTESCIFCESQLTHVQQNIYQTETFHPARGMISTLIEVISEKSKQSSQIPLKEIINAMNLEDEPVIYLLENAIALGQVDGRIDTYQATLNVSTSKQGVICSQCGNLVSESEVISCSSNQHAFCQDCHENLALVGLDSCPECGEQIVIN